MKKLLTTIALGTVISTSAMADVGCDEGQAALMFNAASCDTPFNVRQQMTLFVLASGTQAYASAPRPEGGTQAYISRTLVDSENETDVKGGSSDS